MDAITATVELVKSLAWPIATLVGLTMFRAPILLLIRGIKSVKFGGAEVTIAKQVDEVKALAISIPKPANTLPTETPDAAREIDSLYEIAQMVPRAAVFEAWRRVEELGVETVKSRCPPEIPKALSAPGAFAEALRRYGVIDTPLFVALAKLRTIRNEAAHSSEVDIQPKTASDYVDAALALERDLRNIGQVQVLRPG